MEPETNTFHVEFPNFSGSVLQKLNQQRQQGQLCDITVVVQGHRFRAHKAVLAASSPYFCDQVLLKNSMRVILPDVMHPRVFESILQSCYTGKLLLPAAEIVGFLTAASFLQMWHVVDKCTELLEGNPSVLCQKSSRSSDHQSPSSSCYNHVGEGAESNGGPPDMTKAQEVTDLRETRFPLHTNNQGHLHNTSPADQDHFSSEMTSQDDEGGTSDGTDYPYSRPVYIQPSIMYHKRWVHVKRERYEQDDFDALTVTPVTEDPQISDSDQTIQGEVESMSSNIDSCNADPVKPGKEFEENPEVNHTYDEQVDFYGASMEEFAGERTREPLGSHTEDLVAQSSGDSTEILGDLQEGSPHSGFSAGVYELYPCQCGKSFTHKSQRDRHMSMHLGLRPYGCGVCGKKFKMKHHLVGHMKIHTGIKPYECNICSKRFMWRDSFHRHVSSCTKAHQAKSAEPMEDVS
ncbi:ZBT43 protein, partial [Polypterus senegalus]